MQKNYLNTLFVGLFVISSGNAQVTVDPANCRVGESVEFCREHTHTAELMKDPVFKVQWEKDRATLAEERSKLVAKTKGDITPKAVVYTIPVVFHVLHNGGDENISREQIEDAMFILNRDYNLQNADANSVFGPWQGKAANIEFRFVLATKAPDGTCFSGITRTQSPLSFVTASSQGTSQVNAVVAGNDVFNGQWPGNRYMNIFVCGDIGGAAGYTFRPTNFASIGTQMRNGIWVLSDYVGSIGTGNENRSRTLTHEVGHWFDLPHPWGETNNPGLASNCSDDDGVDDTPDCIGVTSCNVFANTCSTDNAYWGFDQIDNVENYMDYSYCSKMFTEGQATRMRAAMVSTVGGRNMVHTQANLAATGADSNFVLCRANFSADVRTICSGQSVNFKDESYNGIQSWLWSFPGGSPSTSTVKNPIVTYNTPGTYTVILTSTRGSAALTETKTGFIVVLPNGVTLPYSESFEGYTTLSAPGSFWRAVNPAGNGFEINTTAGSQGSKSLVLRNFGQADNSFDEVLSQNFNLSGIPSTQPVTFSFKYAYRKRQTSNFESLRMWLSVDCGETWSQRRSIIGNQLSDLTASTSWTPTPSDWVQVHVAGVTSAFFVNNLQAKFSFQSDEGNNLYIDEINLYQGTSDQLSLESLSDLDNLTLYPNPAEDQVNLRFSVAGNTDVDVQIQDITGKIIQTNLVQAVSGDNLLLMDTQNMATGLYFVKVRMGKNQKTIQFVKK